jgi:hypothetical protein
MGMSGDDTIEAALRKVLEAYQKLAAEKAEPSAEAAALRTRLGALNAAPTTPGEPQRVATPLRDSSKEQGATKRFSVICLQCGLSVDRLIHAKTAQTEIDPVTYRRKCKIAPNATDFYCPELERTVERSRRWDPIFRSSMSRPASCS